MVNDREIEFLTIRLDEADLSLGQLGTLLGNAQAAIRHTATSIYQPPIHQTIRLGRLDLGSLEIGIDVVQWAPHFASNVAGTVLEIADALNMLADEAKTVALNVTGSAIFLGATVVLNRYLLRRGQVRRRIDGDPDEQEPDSPAGNDSDSTPNGTPTEPPEIVTIPFDDIAGSEDTAVTIDLEEILRPLETLEDLRDQRERRNISREVANRLRCDPRRVEAAVAATESVVRMNARIASSGGGRLSSALDERQVEIEKR